MYNIYTYEKMQLEKEEQEKAKIKLQKFEKKRKSIAYSLFINELFL
jgi:hypothetical protein